MSNFSLMFSPTGGTARVARILTDAMGGDWQEIDLCRDVAGQKFTDGDVCLISVPSYGGRAPSIAIERLRRFRGCGAKAVLVCVYGNREWEDTLTELQDTLEGCGFVCAAAAVAEHSIFRQYAAGRPDAQDAEELRGFAARLNARLEQGGAVGLALAGSHGTYKSYGGVPFKPEGNKKCVACGLCAGGCPTGAIAPADPVKTDKAKCISCMRCVSLCPRHARDFSPLVMKPAALAMAKHLGGHKENHLFLQPKNSEKADFRQESRPFAGNQQQRTIRTARGKRPPAIGWRPWDQLSAFFLLALISSRIF